ncbi:MAG: glycogen synthase GlgA [Candidatus Omnitrophica bacterium]|jgi:starch synthase|nr:glycogen synthase GlgA [Candidatus Omnitrophota bacterium]
MKIAVCASEVVPFAKTGGLADVAGALPIALEEAQQEVVIITPFYKITREGKFNLKKIKDGLWCSVIGKNVKVYFLENDLYFNRDALYMDKTGDYKDNLERFSFYSKKALELLKEIDFRPDIIHVHDWQACLAAVYLKTIYRDDPFYKSTSSVLTIHNIGYQGLFAKDEYPKLGLDWGYFNIEQLEYYDKINLLKGGIEFADKVNTVSRTYSQEIQTKEFGFGLEGVLTKRKDSLFGIVNGLDYQIWDPAKDKALAKKFSIANLTGKADCKNDLQKACGFPVNKDTPLFGIVSRLAGQKGFDILAQGIENICKMGLQLVILGTGEEKYHKLLLDMAKKYPKVISLNLKFDDVLAHKIYAGSDLFLMPSRYEPCGLGQLISLKYGTIPVVFKTGGLADTVNSKNGFVFDIYSKDALLSTVSCAIKAFNNKKSWSALVKKAMSEDFSWEQSAGEYIKLYKTAKKKN